jgi:hypothetical protein
MDCFNFKHIDRVTKLERRVEMLEDRVAYLTSKLENYTSKEMLATMTGVPVTDLATAKIKMERGGWHFLTETDMKTVVGRKSDDENVAVRFFCPNVV